MRKYSGLILKLACLVAGLAVLLQIAQWFARRDALASISIPDVPTITNALNTPAPPPAANPTRSTAVSLPASGTNAAAATNRTSQPTNTASPSVTTAASTTAVAPPAKKSSAKTANSPGTNVASTNAAAGTSRTNQASATPGALTNAISASAGAPKPVTQVAAMVPPGPGGRPFGPGPGGVPAMDLPPTVKTRVDRIVDSEILGPVMRPMPMALLGIAGLHVFLRAPDGQTGLIKEGETLGGVKLLKVGTNRVLVEEDGKPKELMIFAGFGGETLMSVTTTNHP